MKTKKEALKWRDGVVTLVLAAYLFAGTGCSGDHVKLDGPKVEKKEIVNLPAIADAPEWSDNYVSYSESVLVLTLGLENELYRESYLREGDKLKKSVNRIEADELPKLLNTFFDDKDPDKLIVYLKADVASTFEDVLKVIDNVRKAEIDRLGRKAKIHRLGMIAVPDAEPIGNLEPNPFVFEVRLPPDSAFVRSLRSNPLVLVVTLHANHRLELNSSEIGTLSEPDRLSVRLKEVFAAREKEGIFREYTNEVEKTALLQVARSVTYGDLVKLAEIVNSAGAEPIRLQLDELEMIDQAGP